MIEALSRFRNPALQFSGGKDSLACLYLLRPHLDQITVYWLNTGDSCPETLSVIDSVRRWIPRFVEVASDVKQWRNTHGMPSDLAPAHSHPLGVAYGMSDIKVTSRFDCCYFNLMLPMHERMLADGVDAVVRGTKLVDTGKLPAEGATGFYDVLLPLRDWSHDQVFEYLESVGAPVNPIYDHVTGSSAPECLGCTAWWDEGKAEYLRARHQQVYREYRISLSTIKAALQSHLVDLESELGE